MQIFGRVPDGITPKPRSAAYAVVRDAAGRVAVVRPESISPSRFWLPGGGIDDGESPEQAVVREVREELGRALLLQETIGDVVQYFHAGRDRCWYEMSITFFRAMLGAEIPGRAEHELHWLDPHRDAGLFFHASHAWAAALE